MKLFHIKLTFHCRNNYYPHQAQIDCVYSYRAMKMRPNQSHLLALPKHITMVTVADDQSGNGVL